ncbi:MAG: hypothetical protein SGILL_007159, partial [Bacillariaceae sp.]
MPLFKYRRIDGDILEDEEAPKESGERSLATYQIFLGGMFPASADLRGRSLRRSLFASCNETIATEQDIMMDCLVGGTRRKFKRFCAEETKNSKG